MAGKEVRHTDIADIDSIPALLRLVEEVHTSRQPRVLSHEGQELVEMKPIASHGKQRAQGKVFTKRDPLWKVVGNIKEDGGPRDVSANVDKYLAEAYADLHR